MIERPESEDDVVAIVRALYARGEKFQVRGRGTLVGDVEGVSVLGMDGYEGVKTYEPGERLLEVKSGTGLEEVREVLYEGGQRLAFDPPDYGGLFSRERGATIGGVVGSGLSGSGRLQRGGVRDHVLGMRVCDGGGRLYKAGGRTVKNVSGFDIGKMVVGSYGRLGVMTDLVLNVIPRAVREATLVWSCDDVLRGGEVSRYVTRKPWNVVSSTWVDEAGGSGGKLFLRLEGESVDVSLGRVRDYVGGEVEVMEGEESEKEWSRMRDGCFLEAAVREGMDIWQVLTSLKRGSEFLNFFLEVFGRGRGYFEWSGSRVWVMTKREERALWEDFWNGERGKTGDRVVRKYFCGRGYEEEAREAWEERLLSRVREIHDPGGLFLDYRESRA
jgi:glycolate oxidase FAD binding subunit